MEQADIVKLRDLFGAAPFVRALGMAFASAQRGECVSTLAVRPDHLQQTGVVHAGVLTTMADHTAGAAAQTLAPEGMFVATVELKISLLRPPKGERLVCRGRVLKPGRQLSFVEAEVHCVEGGKEHLVAKVSATMTMISQKNLV